MREAESRGGEGVLMQARGRGCAEMCVRHDRGETGHVGARTRQRLCIVGRGRAPAWSSLSWAGPLDDSRPCLLLVDRLNCLLP